MPRSFFDQVLVPTPRRRSRSWVTAGSIALHVVALGVIFVLPLTAAFQLPAVHTPMSAVMLATTAPPPMPPEPAPAPPSPTPQLNVDAAPITSADSVTPEVPRPQVSTAPLVPGGLPGVSTGARFTGLPGSTAVTNPLPEPPRAPEQPRRVGGDVVPPKRIAYTAPVYPQIAVASRIEGIVILEATIDAQGGVQNVTVLRSLPLLDRAAIEAVKQWRYEPTRLNGQAIPIIMTVTVNFSLR